MQLFQTGHASAMTELVARYQAPVMAYITRRLGGTIGGQAPAGAEDIFQDTCLRVITRADDFDTRRRFAPWLFRIAHNISVDTARSQNRERATDPATLPEPLPANPGPTPESSAIAAEMKQQLEAAMDTLPEEQRDIVILRDYAGLSFADIAETLGIPLNTVLSRRHRAVGKLRAHLQSQHPDTGFQRGPETTS